VRLVRDSKYSIGKGFGFVTFSSRDEVQKALQMHEQPFHHQGSERALRVVPCHRKQKIAKQHGAAREKSPLTSQSPALRRILHKKAQSSQIAQAQLS